MTKSRSLSREKGEIVEEENEKVNQDKEVRERHSHKKKDRSTERRRDRSRDRRRGRSRSRDRRKDRDSSRDKYRDRDGSRDKYRERDRSRNKDRSRDRRHRDRRDYEREDKDLKRKRDDEKENNVKTDPEVIPPKQKKTVDMLTSKTGGAYIPPARLKMMQAEITDKSGAAYQRIAWEALKKSIHGYINKVNTSNIGPITRDLLKENIVRGRGLLARSIIQAQSASPTFTNVYAALVAIINSKFPNIGQLIVTRLAITFKRRFVRNDKPSCISSAIFLAHLLNQGVAHEVLILQILMLLVEKPTDDSIEVAIAVIKECGMKLSQVSKKCTESVFETLRNILHAGELDKRVSFS